MKRITLQIVNIVTAKPHLWVKYDKKKCYNRKICNNVLYNLKKIYFLWQQKKKRLQIRYVEQFIVPVKNIK